MKIHYMIPVFIGILISALSLGYIFTPMHAGIYLGVTIIPISLISVLLNHKKDKKGEK